MNRDTFFAALRRRESGVFGTSLSQPQVDGVNALLDSFARNRVTDIHHAANILAQVYHETGGYMLGIKETVMPYHRDKRPDDAVVKARLEAAWKAGRLPWVGTPYWRDGAFGRGPIQLSLWPNYGKMGTRLGVPLRQKPELALDPRIGADIAVVGMVEGMFRGPKLADFRFPAALGASPARHPRRIVNGKDGTDSAISRYHRAFFSALSTAGWGGPPAQDAPAPVPSTGAAPPSLPAAKPGWLAAILNFFRKKGD